MTDTRPCDACGVPIRFVRSPSGAWMPVQRVPAVYQVVSDEHAELRARRIEISDHTGGLCLALRDLPAGPAVLASERLGMSDGADDVHHQRRRSPMAPTRTEIRSTSSGRAS